MSDETVNDTLIEFEFEVSIVRILENMFLPSRINIRGQVFPHDEATEEEIELAFVKIDHWFDRVVSRSLAFCQTNNSALTMVIDPTGLNRTGNMLLVTPGDPVDQHLAVLFQAKMKALSAGSLNIGPVRVESDSVTGLAFTFIGDYKDSLPTMEEWVGTHNYFEAPWWERDDASTLDVKPGKDANLDEIPSWAYKLDFLVQTPQNEPLPPTTATILRPFKPKIIDGGKKGDS